MEAGNAVVCIIAVRRFLSVVLGRHRVYDPGLAPVLDPVDRGMDDDQVLVPGMIEVLPKKLGAQFPRGQLGLAHESPFIGKAHRVHPIDDRAMARVADELAIHGFDLALVGVGQGGQAAGGVARLHGSQAGNLDRLNFGEPRNLTRLKFRRAVASSTYSLMRPCSEKVSM